MSELGEPLDHAVVVGDVEPRLIRPGRLGKPRTASEKPDGLLSAVD